MNLLKIISAVSLVAVSAAAYASHEPNQPKSNWDGTSIQFGFSNNTGTTQTTDVNSQVNVTYEKDRWLNNGQFQFQWGKSKDEVTKEKYFFTNQTDYAFNKPRTTFLFLSETFTIDKFSPYDYQGMVAGGLGHDLIRSDKVVWSLQAGPGYRQNRETQTHDINRTPVATTQTNLTWNINKTTQFTQLLQANFSKPYNYYKSQTALTSTLFDHFAVQVSYLMEHYTQIPRFSKNTDKTDTTTLVSVIYNF